MGELSKVLSGGQLAGGNSTSKREENDFYATDPQTLKWFIVQSSVRQLYSSLVKRIIRTKENTMLS